MSEIRSQATPARDELVRILAGAVLDNPGSIGTLPQHAADRILATGWSKPRTVNSAAELDALPRRSVVMDTDEEGHVWIRGRKGLWHCSCDGDEYAWESADMFEEAGGKFAVLFTPGDVG